MTIFCLLWLGNLLFLHIICIFFFFLFFFYYYYYYYYQFFSSSTSFFTSSSTNISCFLKVPMTVLCRRHNASSKMSLTWKSWCLHVALLRINLISDFISTQIATKFCIKKNKTEINHKQIQSSKIKNCLINTDLFGTCWKIETVMSSVCMASVCVHVHAHMRLHLYFFCFCFPILCHDQLGGFLLG